MSKRVIILCVLFCLAGFAFGFGLFSLVAAGASGSGGGLTMVLFCLAGFLLLPGGIGMLLGYRVARTLSVGVVHAGYLAIAALVFSPVLFPDVRIVGPLEGYWLLFTMALVLAGLLLLLHWTLYSAPFEEHLS